MKVEILRADDQTRICLCGDTVARILPCDGAEDSFCEIEEGVLKVSKKYVIVEERAEGIRYALTLAKKGDVVLIAGKGAEKYQDVLGIKTPYNDKDTAINILRESGR